VTQINIIDRSVKVLIRRVPPAFFRLAGIETGDRPVRLTDVSVNLPEYRADQVFLVGEEGDPGRWALHLEYQIEPDPRVVRGWFLKNAALTAQLDMDVLLVAVYLTRAGRATFTEAYTASAGGLRNGFHFHATRLWEHADRIRSGDLGALAPLLPLCEDNPTEDTLRRERELILALDVPREVRAELLGLAVSVGTRYFAQDLLRTVFREEMQMLKEASFIEQWINEAAERAAAEGEDRGRRQQAREGAMRALHARFGADLPPSVVARVQGADIAWCLALIEGIAGGKSAAELGLPEIA
jgi:predicted transposase YdaD